MEHVSVGTTGWVGLHPKDYARQFDTVEFNWTFHEREDSCDHFKNVAQELQQLRIQAILKVSGLATHENRLRHPEKWLPGLWDKYSQLHNAGVLGGLLWQLPPSFRCTAESLRDLELLAGKLPRDVNNIFEFRHSSWYKQKRVLDILRRHHLCMAWIHIANEDGWCGDLPSGWPSMDRTCKFVYFRLFGTKRKAVGRYSDEFLRGQILPHLQGNASSLPEEIFVVFAQADVPDHAKADASALMDLLGRSSASPSRSTRWERDVLAATLGLEAGSVVDGVVQKITHRTIFVDIGRSCKATLCVHHARRVGLLEDIHLGTGLHGLVVENVDFQNEWGIIGLTCNKAVIGILGGDLSVADPTAASSTEDVNKETAHAKKGRWTQASAGSKIGSQTGPDSQSQTQVGDLPEKEDPATSASGNAELQGMRARRWGRQEFPPAAKKRELEALERAEARKGQTHIYLRLPSPPTKKAKRVAKSCNQSVILQRPEDHAARTTAMLKTDTVDVFLATLQINDLLFNRFDTGRDNDCDTDVSKAPLSGDEDGHILSRIQQIQEEEHSPIDDLFPSRIVEDEALYDISEAVEKGCELHDAVACETIRKQSHNKMTLKAHLSRWPQPPPYRFSELVARQTQEQKLPEVKALLSQSISEALESIATAMDTDYEEFGIFAEEAPGNAQTRTTLDAEMQAQHVPSTLPVDSDKADAQETQHLPVDMCEDSEETQDEMLDTADNVQQEVGDSKEGNPSGAKSNRWAKPSLAIAPAEDSRLAPMEAQRLVAGAMATTAATAQELHDVAPVEQDATSEEGSEDEDEAEEEETEDEEEGDIYVAVCDLCGATHLMDIDVMSLGFDFDCSQVGFECEGATDQATPNDPAASSSTQREPSAPVLPERAAKLEALSREEKQDLFSRHAMQLQAAKLNPKDVHKGVRQLFEKSLPKERYRDSMIVTRKGERFIKINVSLDPGPGCEIGGVMGYRTKMGRRGLGMTKMTKEEADRVGLSNKNRSHERKTTGPGGYKQGYVFETRKDL